MKKRFIHQSTRNLEPHKLEVFCEPNASVPYKPKCFYASAYLGEDSKYPSEWVKWCIGEEYNTCGDLFIFDVDMSNVLVIDTVEDYKRATRLYHSPNEGLGNYYYYFRPDFAFMDGWKGVYYTQNIAHTLHLNGVSDHAFGSIETNYSDLNALDTDQILIFDPSIIDMSSFKRLPYTWSTE